MSTTSPSEDRLIQLLMLMGVNASAERAYRTYCLLESSIYQQRKSMLDSMFALIGGIATVLNYLTLLQVPQSLPYVLGVSIAILALFAFYWWRGRKAGYELLENARRFGAYLDQMRHALRELQFADAVKDDPNVEGIRRDILESLRTALEGIDSLIGNIDETDFLTLGVSKVTVMDEIKKVRAAAKNHSQQAGP